MAALIEHATLKYRTVARMTQFFQMLRAGAGRPFTMRRANYTLSRSFSLAVIMKAEQAAAAFAETAERGRKGSGSRMQKRRRAKQRARGAPRTPTRQAEATLQVLLVTPSIVSLGAARPVLLPAAAGGVRGSQPEGVGVCRGGAMGSVGEGAGAEVCAAASEAPTPSPACGQNGALPAAVTSPYKK